jgi:hypothetical protein
MKRTIIVPALVTAFVALSPVGVALADNPHDPTINPTGPATGQPSFTEDPATSPPGHSSPGFVNVGSQHYAGEVLNPNNGNTAKAVSQYDVAGFQCAQHQCFLHHPAP